MVLIMKQIVLTILCVLSGWSVSRGQTDANRPISELIAGSIRSELSLSGTNALWGLSSNPSSSTGCPVSNPAMLGRLAGRGIVFEWAPGLSMNIKKIADVDRRIQSGLNGIMDDYGKKRSPVAFPSVSPFAGFKANLTAFEAAFPFELSGKRCGFQLGYSSLISLEYRLVETGMEVGIDSEQRIQEELKRVLMRTLINLDGLLRFQVSRIRFGAGIELGKGTALGIELSRFQAGAEARARANIDGIVQISGNETVFNDPDDPRIDFNAGEQNDLNQSFTADYSGSGWGLRFGAVKDLSSSFRIGMALDLPPDIRMGGTDSLVNNRIPFILIGGDGLIDPTRIDPAKLTRTENVIQRNQIHPVLKLAKAMDFGACWSPGKIRLTFGYTRYFGDFSIGSPKTGEIGVRLRQGVNLGMDFTRVFITAAAEFAVALKSDGRPGRPLVIPKIQLGFRIPVLSGFRIESLVGVEPIPSFRIAGKYRF
jgi:hypothetical protein